MRRATSQVILGYSKVRIYTGEKATWQLKGKTNTPFIHTIFKIFFLAQVQFHFSGVFIEVSDINVLRYSLINIESLESVFILALLL